MAFIFPPSASGIRDSQEWPGLAPDPLSYLAVDLIGGQLSRPRAKQTQARDMPCGRWVQGTCQGRNALFLHKRSRSLILLVLEVSQGGLRAAASSPGGSAGAQREGREAGLGLLSAQLGNLGRRFLGLRTRRETVNRVEKRASHYLAILFGFVAEPLSEPIPRGPCSAGPPLPPPYPLTPGGGPHR